MSITRARAWGRVLCRGRETRRGRESSRRYRRTFETKTRELTQEESSQLGREGCKRSELLLNE
jgi:hypothetical protein